MCTTQMILLHSTETNVLVKDFSYNNMFCQLASSHTSTLMFHLKWSLADCHSSWRDLLVALGCAVRVSDCLEVGVVGSCCFIHCSSVFLYLIFETSCCDKFFMGFVVDVTYLRCCKVDRFYSLLTWLLEFDWDLDLTCSSLNWLHRNIIWSGIYYVV